ncbi:hypothetical protein B0H16DRAFT_143373 [Mycena metata]|uniref:Uncharacterized protein n=1 Tax=Mycena metata TaxID=1033252 RepID=A0AAD7JYP0_9AGAR|nr:hypothetical protein B0H16DRAFT_143373 [Mycena metata]
MATHGGSSRATLMSADLASDPSDPLDRGRLSAERAQLKASLSTALKEDDDPLAAYDRFVKWTVKNYGDDDPSSGLRELLQEATSAFKSDPVYKADLRYLKLWLLYVRQLTRADGIATFAFLLANGIGASYSILYEEYANILELDGRNTEAETVYRKGIKRQVRPLERLKIRYRDFKGRSAASDPDTTPTQNSKAKSGAITSSSSTSSSLVTNESLATTAESRYAQMFAPPAPGKRPEQPKFDLSLLFSDGKEYCIEEARARSIGLYGKKWPAPPPPPSLSSPLGQSAVSSSSSSSLSSVKVNFNDDGQGSSRLGASRRRSMMGGAEPTVTINTKEALADVFGMFNSPEKTAKLAAIVKNKKIEPATPVPQPVRKPGNDENSYAKTPQPAFRPYVDENAGANLSRKENTPAKFVPFVDPETSKTPSFAPRVALSQKETPTPVGNLRGNPSKITVNKLSAVPEDASPPAALERNVFKVFTPAIHTEQPKPTPLPLRDVFTDDHGKPQPRPTHERAKSYHDSVTPAPPFKPLVDENSGIRTPFKVFSRPPGQGENAVTPGNNPVFTPFKEAPNPTPSAFTPFQEVKEEPKAPSPPPRTPSWSNAVVEIADDDEDETEQYQDDYQYDDDEDNGVGEYLPLDQEPEAYEDTGDDESYQVPLGGRFGQFTVMTPITERTFEFTSTTARSSTFGGTPSRVLGQVDEDDDTGGSWRDQQYAVTAAERLAAELQAEDEEEYDEEPLPQPSNGALRLVDTLKLSSNFKPPNPCNPFDREIMSSLLALIIPDQYCYDLRGQDANMLDPLQKFAKRARKTSGNTSNTTGLLDGSWFPLTIAGHRFSVCEKLGEGGFGAVFKAKDLGTQEQEDTDEEDEDDEDGSSMVALKVVKPRNLWEYRVLRRLHSALPPQLRRSVVLPHALFAFRDESYLVLDLCPQGTLLNIVNGANAASLSQAGGTLDELLVMFFAVELLRIVEAMHAAGFIHGDLKIDNCLLRLEDVPGGPAAWASMYSPRGEDGWACKGLKLIDFGRAIDTRLFPSGQQFVGDWDADERDCFELREQRPWTYQTDYFGLAGIVYCLLFGRYIQGNSVSTKDGRHKIDTPLKRYWQTEIWEKLFGILLNPCAVRGDASLPLCSELAEVRAEMEAWLQSSCNRASNTLKGLLKKVQVLCI